MSAIGEAGEFVSEAKSELGNRFNDFVSKTQDMFGMVTESASSAAAEVGSGFMNLAGSVGSQAAFAAKATAYTVGATAMDLGQAAKLGVTKGPAAVADWFDGKAKETNRILENYVQNNPSQMAVLGATAISTAIAVGQGEVDVLRIGQGIKRGTVGGAVEDGFRLIGIATHASPALRAAGKPAIRVGRSALARLVTDPGRGICGYVATAQAVTQTGTRLFAKIEDVVKAANAKTIEHLPGIHFVHELMPTLKKLGAEVERLPALRGEADLVKMLKARRGAIIFGFRGTSRGEQFGHAVYAHTDLFGRFRIVDRPANGGRIFSSLSEVQRKYGRIESLSDAVFIHEAKLISPEVAKAADMTAGLAVPMRTVINTDRNTARDAVKYYKSTQSGMPIQINGQPW